MRFFDKGVMMVNLPILCLSRDASIQESLVEEMREIGFEVLVASDIETAWRLMFSREPWLLMIHIGEKLNGEIGFVERVLATRRILVLSTLGCSDLHLACQLMKAGWWDVFAYPQESRELLREVLRLGRNGSLPMEIETREATAGWTVWDRRIEWREHERRRLEYFLQDCGGNISRVAKRMGCARGTVYNRMRILGISLGQHKRDY